MTTRRIRLDAHTHAAFLAEQRKDPITKEPLRAGSEIIICANDKIAFIADNWPGTCPICNYSETLSYIPQKNFPERLGRANRSQTRPRQTLQPRMTRFQTKSPWLAVALSFFILGGGGQIYLGQITKGVVLILATLASSIFGLGFFVGLIGMIDAYNITNKINRGIPVGDWEFNIGKGTIIAIVLAAGLFFFCCIATVLLAPFINEILKNNFTTP